MNDMNVLINNGININRSLQLLKDISLYNETLDTFYSEIDEKLQKLVSYKQINDISNYAILVQGLKTESNYLGFDKLYQLLYQHEMACKINDSNYINNHFNELLTEFNKLVQVIREYKGMNQDSKGSILVVDDSNIIRNFVSKIFKDKYDVLTAEDGNQAIEIVESNKNILCVLLDLNMPNVNGFEVLEYFKTNNLFKEIPVSLLTGDDTQESIDRAFKYPIVDMLSKPFNEESVKAIVDKTISVHNFN